MRPLPVRRTVWQAGSGSGGSKTGCRRQRIGAYFVSNQLGQTSSREKKGGYERSVVVYQGLEDMETDESTARRAHSCGVRRHDRMISPLEYGCDRDRKGCAITEPQVLGMRKFEQL